MVAAFKAYKAQIFKHKAFALPGLFIPGIANVFTSYIPPLVIATMITDFHGQIPKEFSDAMPYIGVLAAAWLFGEALWRIAFLLLNRADSRGIESLYVESFDALLKKDMSFFNENFAGSLTKKISGYSKNYESFIDTLAFNVFGNVLPLIFASVILWTISPYLVLAMISIIAITFVCIVPLIKRRQSLTITREENSNKVAGHISDVIGNIAAVQAFSHHSRERARHKVLVHDYMRSALKSWDYHVLKIDMFVAPMYVIANVIGLTLAIYLTDNSAALAAVFLAFNYFVQATRILFEFNRTYRNLENALTEAGQFTDLIKEPPRLRERADAKDLQVKDARINFTHVDFAFADDPEHFIFKDMNLSIPAGQKVALVGHSGGGKTTITRLLLRFNDINGGRITIDGQDIAAATMSSLRHSIAYVPQEPVMFHRSILENIRYGRPEATDTEVKRAAKKAHATEFIDKLSEGFDTLVGERGVKLSGGQRQRIAIARAILKDAPILVLDEATSALDSDSEKLIQKSLNELMKNRTSFVIAHRLSTVQKMDRILVLEYGSIVEDGTHDELVKHDGIYAALWSHQSGGFIEE